MKIIYNNTELQDNTKKYSTLLNKPSINGHVLEGNLDLDTLSLYDKPTTEKLVEATSQIRLVSEMPVDPEPSMTYYVGPDERDLYDVILVNDAKQLIHMGTTQFGQYKSGPGVNVTFDNHISINTDDVSILLDSEGRLKSNLDGNSLDPFTGATASTAGTKGIVPKPLAKDEFQLLRGDGQWVDLVDIIHPIGNIYITYDSSTNPNTLFPGQTWEKLDAGYLLRSTTDGGLGHPTVGVPNIKGTHTSRPAFWFSQNPGGVSGAWSTQARGQEAGGYSGSSGFNIRTRVLYTLDASKYNSIYSDFDSVQAPSIDIVAWRRTA